MDGIPFMRISVDTGTAAVLTAEQDYQVGRILVVASVAASARRRVLPRQATPSGYSPPHKRVDGNSIKQFTSHVN